VAGPLTARIQAKKEAPPEPPKPESKKQKPRPKKDPAKKKDPFRHKLRMFNGIEQGGFHPTLEIRTVRDDNGNITGIKQMWRKRRSEEFEWRNAKDFDPELDNTPVPTPTASEIADVPAEVQTEPLVQEPLK
jgi:hypothetical protein